MYFLNPLFIFNFVTCYWVGAAIGAGASLAGGMMGNSSAKKEAVKQRAWAEAMERSKHQIQVADLKAAGLNPMLSSFNSLSSPHGSTAQQSNPAAGAGEIIANADLKNSAKEMNVAQVGVLNSQQSKNVAEADLASAQAAEARERTPTHGQSILESQSRITNMKAELPIILERMHLTQSEIRKVESEITQIAKQGVLTEAQTKEALARAGLTTAQITEVAPRINHMVSQTEAIDKSMPVQELKGDAAKIVDILPKMVHSAKEGNTIGSDIYDFIHEYLPALIKDIKRKDQARRKSLHPNR